MALTVTDGTHSVTSVDTITLNSAGTVSGGSSHATITGSDPVKVYLPGGLGTDSGGATSTIATYDIASRTGSTINITWFENNAGIPTSTEGYYLTLARAESVGGTATCNVDEILAAALLYSSTNGVAIYVPAGTYELTGAVSQQTLLTNTTLIGAPNFQTTFTLAFDRPGSSGAFLISGDNVSVQDIVVAGANASYVNFFTNQLVSVSGSAATASLFDWQTVSIGDLAANSTTLLLDGFGWQLSTDPDLAPQMSSSTILFDSLPSGYTSYETLSAALEGSFVLWNYAMKRGVTVMNVTEPMSGTYALNLYPFVDSSGKTYTIIRNGFPPRVASDTAALDPVAQTISNPDYLAQQVLPPAFIQFATTQPAYYTGDCFHIKGDFASFRNVACVGITEGIAYVGECRNPRFTNTHCLATFGDDGCAGFRFIGLGAVFDGCVCNSGDDGAQQSQQPGYDPHYLNTMNNPSYDFTGSTFAERWIGRDITTIGSGRACAIDLDATPNGTPLTWTSNGTTFSSSSVQFAASDAPAGLTLSMLGLSAAPWAPGFGYETLTTLMVNKGHLYSLAGTGTSATSGSGPSPTSTTSVITDGSCSWSYLSAGETIYIYDNGLAGTEPGAYVTGYMDESGTVTVMATAPLVNFSGTWTTTADPFTAYDSGTDFIFLLSASSGTAASPPMIMDNSVDFQFERCTLRSLASTVALIANHDSFGTARAAFHGCTFDGSWCLAPNEQDAMMSIVGNPIAGAGGSGAGGCRVTVDECRFYAPAFACISSQGVNSYISISRSELYPPSINTGTLASVLIGGAAQLDFVENTVWAPQSVGAEGYKYGVVTLGTTTTTTSTGLVLPGNVSNARIVGNRFLALYAEDGYTTPGLNIDYAGNVTVSNNIFAAGANPTAPTVTGIAITENATNVISVGNSFLTCQIAYSGTLTQLSINGSEVYDTGATPPTPTYPGLAALIAPQVVSWAPTLSCVTNPGSLTLTSVTQTGTMIRTALSDGTFKNDIQFSISGTCTPGSASGNLRIAGLPYAGVSTGVQGVSLCPPILSFVWAYPTGMLVWTVEPSETYLTLANMKSGGVRTLQSITSISGAFSLSGFGFYLSPD